MIDHLPLLVVLTTWLLLTVVVFSRWYYPRRLFIGNITYHFWVSFYSEFFVLLHLSGHFGRSVEIARIFVVKATKIMIVHRHEISHCMLVGVIVVLRIERGNIIEPKLLLYIIFNYLVAFLEIVHFKPVTSVLYEIVRIEDVLLLLIYIFPHTSCLILSIWITGLLNFPIRWLVLRVEVLGAIGIIEIGRLIHLVGIDLINNKRTQNTFSLRLQHILSIFHKQKRLLWDGLHSLRSHTYTIKKSLLRYFLSLS